MLPTTAPMLRLLLITFILLSSLSSHHARSRCSPWYCSAFQGATISTTTTRRRATASQRQRQQSWSSSSSIEIQSRRSYSTAIFERKDKDNDEVKEKANDNDNDAKRPVNNLDIFGQPKDKKDTTKKNSFFHNNDNDGEIYGSDKIKSCIPYILPLIDGDTFGKYIYERIPPLGNLDYLFLRPLVESVQAAPILSILLFTSFAIGPRFVNLSRDVRFNAQQAVLLDLCLILPTLLGDTISEADVHLSRSILEPTSNFVWYANVSMVIYCIVSNLRGKRPDGIPFISAAADYAIGPF